MVDIHARSTGSPGRWRVSQVTYREIWRTAQAVRRGPPAATDGRGVGGAGGNGLPPLERSTTGNGVPAGNDVATGLPSATGTAPGDATPPSAAGASPGAASVAAVVARLDDYVQSMQRDLRFMFDSRSGRGVVRIADPESGELIRQIPSEVALRLARNLERNLEGIRGASGNGASARVAPAGRLLPFAPLRV
jgi:flagellar protein FlaG